MANVTKQLHIQEQQVSPGVYAGVVEFQMDFSSFTQTATTEAMTIPEFPANAIPLKARIAIGAYFTGGGVTACTAQIGDSGDPNGLMAAVNVFDTTSLATWTGTAGVEAEYGSTGPSEESAYAPEILFTTTTANVDDLTAGFLTGQIFYKRYDQ